MTVNDVYKLCQYIVNKNQQGYLAPDDFNRTIRQAQIEYVAYLLGNFQTYTPGRPISRVELGQNSVVRQRLSPVIYGYILDINATTGFSPYPGDFIQVDAMWGIYGRTNIRYCQQDYLAAYYNSVIDPIATNPIYIIEDEGFRFFPETQWKARLSYVRNPPTITWGYTLDGNGRAVYDAASSIDPVWDDAAIWDIVSRQLAMVGVNLQAPQIMQYAAEIKTTGQ